VLAIMLKVSIWASILVEALASSGRLFEVTHPAIPARISAPAATAANVARSYFEWPVALERLVGVFCENPEEIELARGESFLLAIRRVDLEGQVTRELQRKLKDYVLARIDLYRMPHDLSLWQ
jgi:hypothetical protein